MSFFQSIATCFKNIVNFKGRARRSEYWWFRVFVFIISGILAAVLGQESTVASLVSFVLLIATWSVEVRRLHDVGKSGWFVFIDLIPIVGWIILLVMLIKDSQPGTNQYGPNPKGV